MRPVAVLAVVLAFIVGYGLLRAAVDWDLFSLIAAVGLGAVVMGLIGLYDQRATA